MSRETGDISSHNAHFEYLHLFSELRYISPYLDFKSRYHQHFHVQCSLQNLKSTLSVRPSVTWVTPGIATDAKTVGTQSYAYFELEVETNLQTDRQPMRHRNSGKARAFDNYSAQLYRHNQSTDWMQSITIAVAAAEMRLLLMTDDALQMNVIASVAAAASPHPSLLGRY